MSRRILITGSSRGIGRAISEEFSGRGWTIVGPSRAELDLSDPVSVAAYCALDLGPIDVLINNAGENVVSTIDNSRDEDLRRMMEVNFFSCWTLIRRFAGGMAARSWGRIINVASIYGIRSRVGRAAYSSSKAALMALTRSAAVEYGASNVLVNALAPGFVETELTRRNNSDEQLAQLCSQVPLARLGRPEEIAAFAYWLASDENSFLTGQTIPIDGGFLAR